MPFAIFDNQVQVTTTKVENPERVNTATVNTATANAVFKDITVTTSEDKSFGGQATLENQVNSCAVAIAKSQFTVIVERVTTSTLVVEGDQLIFTAGQDLLKDQPVIVNLSDEVELALASDLTHCGRFVGFVITDTLQGNPCPVKISGTITNAAWSWDINKELYLSNTGTLIQDLEGTEEYILEIANVLTPTIVLITRNEPVEVR